MSGELSVLNVGDGDTKFSFDSKNPMEAVRAGRIVKDMLRRGYILFVKAKDGQYVRATEFDEKTNEYIIADLDPPVVGEGNESQGTESEATPTAKAPGKTRRGRRVKASGTHSLAVGRVAGG